MSLQHHPVDGNKVPIDANIGVVGIIVCSVNYNAMSNFSLSGGPSGQENESESSSGDADRLYLALSLIQWVK